MPADCPWRPGNAVKFTSNGEPVDLISINGMGEIRWPVWASHITDALTDEAENKLDPKSDGAMHLAAFRHLQLQLA